MRGGEGSLCTHVVCTCMCVCVIHVCAYPPTCYCICVPPLQPPIPLTEGLDVLALLTDSAKIARWNNENLPNDRMSIENATILTNAERWPLMIDPQLQGVKWIKTREGAGLKVVRLGTKG